MLLKRIDPWTHAQIGGTQHSRTASRSASVRSGNDIGTKGFVFSMT
jgi:hypothetical protein